MPVYMDDKLVKVGGTVLPGLIKSLEITQEAALDEVEVEGSAVKPKQAVGYEDAKIKLELVLDSSPDTTAEAKLDRINGIFRRKGQQIPQPFEMVSRATVAAGIGKVIMQKLTSKWTNKTEQCTVTMELCQYIPVPITVAQVGSSDGQTAISQASGALSETYQSYLSKVRGSAPLLSDTPAIDDRTADAYRSYLASLGMPE